MGIFSTLGQLFAGPVGAGIGGVVDGVAGHVADKKRTKDQNRLEMDKFVRLRKAAERGGFHPLSVLQAGGTVDATAAPRLLTSLSSTNAFDALENEISGDAAKERERQRINDEIAARELENLKIGIARSYQNQSSIPSGASGPPDYNGREGNPDEWWKFGLKDPEDLPADQVGMPQMPMVLGGFEWESSPYWSAANTAEENYGDLASFVYGIAKVGGDVFWNWKRFNGIPGHLNVDEALAYFRERNAAENDAYQAQRPGRIMPVPDDDMDYRRELNLRALRY